MTSTNPLPNGLSVAYKRMGKGMPDPLPQEFCSAYLDIIRSSGKHGPWKKKYLADPSGMWRVDALVIDALPNHPVPEDAPATSFWANGEFIVVMSRSLLPHVMLPDLISERDEAVLHELYEVLFLQQLCLVEGYFQTLHSVPHKLLRIAHIASTARLIKEFGGAQLLPLHRRDISLLSADEADTLLGEPRQENHTLLGQYFPDFLKHLIEYEHDLVRPALAKRINVTTQPIALLSRQPSHKTPPRP